MDWIWLDFVNWTKLLKNFHERQFFRNSFFSRKKGVGLRLYTDYMISKNGYDWFQWVLTCFALKMEFFWKSDKEWRTLWFLWFLRIWSVKRTCILNCTYMWSKCIHSWGTRVFLLSFDSIVSIVLKLYNDRWENDLEDRIPCKSFVNSLIWLYANVWMINRCWTWCLS
jgi:hypothetical protein